MRRYPANMHDNIRGLDVTPEMKIQLHRVHELIPETDRHLFRGLIPLVLGRSEQYRRRTPSVKDMQYLAETMEEMEPQHRLAQVYTGFNRMMERQPNDEEVHALRAALRALHPKTHGAFATEYFFHALDEQRDPVDLGNRVTRLIRRIKPQVRRVENQDALFLELSKKAIREFAGEPVDWSE